MPHGQRAYQWLSDANVFVSIDPVSLFGQCGRGQGCGHLHFHSSSPTLTVRSILIQLIVGKLTIFEGFMVAGRNSAHPETLASLPPALLSAYHPSKWMYFWRSCSDTPCTHMSPLSTRPDLPKKAMCSTHHVLVATFPLPVSRWSVILGNAKLWTPGKLPYFSLVICDHFSWF